MADFFISLVVSSDVISSVVPFVVSGIGDFLELKKFSGAAVA